MSGKFSMDRQLLPSSSQMLSNLSFILFTQTRTFQDIIRSSRRWITRERTRFGWTGEKTYWKKSFDQREDWNFLPKVRSIPFYSTVLFPKKCFIEHSIRKRWLIFRKCSVMTQKGLYICRSLIFVFKYPLYFKKFKLIINTRQIFPYCFPKRKLQLTQNETEYTYLKLFNLLPKKLWAFPNFSMFNRKIKVFIT